MRYNNRGSNNGEEELNASPYSRLESIFSRSPQIPCMLNPSLNNTLCAVLQILCRCYSKCFDANAASIGFATGAAFSHPFLPFSATSFIFTSGIFISGNMPPFFDFLPELRRSRSRP